MGVNNPDEIVTLSNGIAMPIFGLGTTHNGGYSHDSVVYALKTCNYRLIDTAKRYGCEAKLRQALLESGVPRDLLFITDKLWPTDYGANRTRPAFFGSLERLGTDYLDLFLLHFPSCPTSLGDKKKVLLDTWRALEKLYDEGYIKAIGVSNYDEEDLIELLDECSVRPHVNQVEYHPFQNPSKLHDFCKDNSIQLEGYCPLGKGRILHAEELMEIAKRYKRTAAQICIRWSIQNGVVAIPKSTKENRLFENCQVFDFELTPEDMLTLNNLPNSVLCISKSDIQAKLDSPDPDGYRLDSASTIHGDGIPDNLENVRL